MYRFLVNLCLVGLHMGSNSVEASYEDDVFGEIVYDYPVLTAEYEMPSSCQGMNYCFDKGGDYPESKFEDLLDQMPVSLGSRIATNYGGNPDCPVNDTFVNKPIYYIRDIHNKVRPVAQSPEKFQQIYSVKWCQRPGRITENTPHFMKGSRTLKKYRIECVNQYMDADFLVLSNNGLKLQLAKPKGGIPICCRCRYSKLDVY